MQYKNHTTEFCPNGLVKYAKVFMKEVILNSHYCNQASFCSAINNSGQKTFSGLQQQVTVTTAHAGFPMADSQLMITTCHFTHSNLALIQEISTP